jgi:predicted TPR repeat methyltransferase
MTAPRDSLASGDLIADRRYAYGERAAGDGDFAAAADMFEQALERAPYWPAALFALGEARERLGRREAAAEAFRRALAADPSDTLGAAARLALIGAAEPPEGLPPAYVARLFDDYAPRFEAHLVGALAYRGPALLVAALDAATPGRRFAAALDLGCGTGLMGAAIRDRVTRLKGVDLAPAMIACARARGGLYDALEAGEATAFLERAPQGAYDLILAADTLCYFGDLRPVFAAGRRALRPGGLMALTAETFVGDGLRLLKGLRYAHSPHHIEDAARAAGLRIVLLRHAWARREADVEAPGLVAVLAAD